MAYALLDVITSARWQLSLHDLAAEAQRCDAATAVPIVTGILASTAAAAAALRQRLLYVIRGTAAVASDHLCDTIKADVDTTCRGHPRRARMSLRHRDVEQTENCDCAFVPTTRWRRRRSNVPTHRSASRLALPSRPSVVSLLHLCVYFSSLLLLLLLLLLLDDNAHTSIEWRL